MMHVNESIEYAPKIRRFRARRTCEGLIIKNMSKPSKAHKKNFALLRRLQLLRAASLRQRPEVVLRGKAGSTIEGTISFSGFRTYKVGYYFRTRAM